MGNHMVLLGRLLSFLPICLASSPVHEPLEDASSLENGNLHDRFRELMVTEDADEIETIRPLYCTIAADPNFDPSINGFELLHMALDCSAIIGLDCLAGLEAVSRKADLNRILAPYHDFITIIPLMRHGHLNLIKLFFTHPSWIRDYGYPKRVQWPLQAPGFLMAPCRFTMPYSSLLSVAIKNFRPKVIEWIGEYCRLVEIPDEGQLTLNGPSEIICVSNFSKHPPKIRDTFAEFIRIYTDAVASYIEEDVIDEHISRTFHAIAGWAQFRRLPAKERYSPMKSLVNMSYYSCNKRLFGSVLSFLMREEDLGESFVYLGPLGGKMADLWRVFRLFRLSEESDILMDVFSAFAHLLLQNDI